jgi:hypothetical protein
VKYQTEQINLFITLVNEGLIDADIHKPIEELSFTSATVRGLSGQGLQLIQELPDPNRALLDRLDAMTVAIQELRDVPPEEKEAAEKALEELKDFVRKVTPAAAVQFLAELFTRPGG